MVDLNFLTLHAAKKRYILRFRRTLLYKERLLCTSPQQEKKTLHTVLTSSDRIPVSSAVDRFLFWLQNSPFYNKSK